MQQNQSGTAPEGLPEDQSTGHTLREIADAIGVDKSTVFRYVQRCGIAPIDATQRCKRYSATAENDIIQHFATMRNDSKTMLGRLAMMRNSSGNDAGNDAQGLQRCSATTPDSSGELDRVTADRDKLAAERDALRDQLDAEKAAHKEEADQLRERFMKLSEDYADKFAKFTENAQQIADQAQRLQAAQLQKEEPKPIETPATPEEITPQDKPPTFWQRIFGKK